MIHIDLKDINIIYCMHTRRVRNIYLIPVPGPEAQVLAGSQNNAWDSTGQMPRAADGDSCAFWQPPNPPFPFPPTIYIPP